LAMRLRKRHGLASAFHPQFQPLLLPRNRKLKSSFAIDEKWHCLALALTSLPFSLYSAMLLYFARPPNLCDIALR